ncbi:MAG: glucose-phosphate thymidylyltransferase [Candidatus Sumerlaeota bacterium]|nr:glucose-phosphate thymidylyltransferase [Candidatus Sumerlaeota bacterium]
MKAIIPVAGFGTRMRPHTWNVPKVLMNVAGKPMLDHIMDDLIEAGVTGVTFIVGFLGDEIEKHIRATYPKIETNFVVQKEMLGLGHAISLGKKYHQKDKDLLIILGDTIVRADFKKLFKSKHTELGVREVEDPRRFGVVKLDAKGNISGMVEKPKDPPTNLAIVGVYKINDPALLFKGLDHIIKKDIRTAKEIQLTDALAWMLEKGHVMRPFAIDGWLDCGKPETLFETNAAILAESPKAVQAGYRKRYREAVIIPPVFIGDGVELAGAVIGPNAVLGKGTKVSNAVVRDSIIGENATIANAVLKDSLVGDDAVVEGTAASLNVTSTSVCKY